MVTHKGRNRAARQIRTSVSSVFLKPESLSSVLRRHSVLSFLRELSLGFEASYTFSFSECLKKALVEKKGTALVEFREICYHITEWKNA